MNAGAYLVVAPGLIAASLSLGCLGTPSPLTPETGGSVGLPYKGVLTAPVPLPARGKGYIRIKADGNHYGTSALVRTLQHASAEVDRQRPGPPLQIGDLSSIRGGKIIHHASHRSGRDVDLIFYATSLGGAMIPAQGFTRYGPDALGIAHQGVHGRVYLRLDIERNWLLAKALVLSPFADVMWLFVSNPIKALLTEYAFARGEDPLLVWQAENVMLQPRNALPHDDHFHLRIMCPGDSAVFGCEEGGPYWPWLSPAPALDWPHSVADIPAFIDVGSFPPI